MCIILFMTNQLIVFFLGLLAGLVALHPPVALASSPELYWKTALPNTPIPSSIHDLLHPPETTNLGGWTSPESEEEATMLGYDAVYYNAATAAQLRNKSSRSMLFLEKDLFPGATFDLQFKRFIPKQADLLPRRVADTLPFSSDKLPDVLELLSVDTNSKEARQMSATLERCESPANARETKHCATSIESMVDFAVSALATNDVSAVSTVVNATAAAAAMQRYAVEGFERIDGEGLAVLCRAMPYAYVVFHCRAVGKAMRQYAVSLKGSDGSRVEAIAGCHLDTTSWNPRNGMLQVKPGNAEPVCHFLPPVLVDHILWTPRRQLL